MDGLVRFFSQKTHLQTIYRVLEIIRYQTNNNHNPHNPTTICKRQIFEFGQPKSSLRSVRVYNICYRVYVMLSYTYKLLTTLFLNGRETMREYLSDVMTQNLAL